MFFARTTVLTLMGLACVGLPAQTLRAEYDIAPYLSAGRILTGGQSHGGDDAASSLYAFGYMFGEDPLLPYSLGDPGINAPSGALTPGTTLRFDILTPLLFWNGDGPPAFTAAPAGVALDLMRFQAPSTLLQVAITAGTASQDGFSIATVASDGHVHAHLTSALSATDPLSPHPGVYALGISLFLDGLPASRSDLIYIAYGNEVQEQVLDSAVEHLNAAAVPEPAGLGLLALGASALLIRRRHAQRG